MLVGAPLGSSACAAKSVWINVAISDYICLSRLIFYLLIRNTFSLLWFNQNESNIQQGESTVPPLVLVDSTHEHFCKAPEMSIADMLSH